MIFYVWNRNQSIPLSCFPAGSILDPESELEEQKLGLPTFVKVYLEIFSKTFLV